MLVAFTALGGETVYVESTMVASLTPVPANLLPSGVPDATYCNEGGGPERVAVRGTVAATAAALASGAASALGLYAAVLVLKDGTTTGATSGINNVVRSGPGEYVVTLNDDLGPCYPQVTPVVQSLGDDAPLCDATPAGNVVQVRMQSRATGALVDSAFSFCAFGALG